ncbi:MAG: glutaredoxin family protein [Deltaproteobacteria bacterium]|nr:glutaredoxin family protein [Deltaproteobacteria bacterium]
MQGEQEHGERTSRAMCEVHGLALGDDHRCVLCRRAEGSSRPRQPLVRVTMVVAGLVLTGLTVYAVIKYGGLGDGGVVPVAESPVGDEAELDTAADDPTSDARRGNRKGATRPKRRPRRKGSPGSAGQTASDPGAATDTEQPARDDRQQQGARELEILKEMRRVPIKVYMTKWCPLCTKTRAWLKAKGYRFREYDVESDREAGRTQDRLNPAGTVPTLDIEGEVLVGFSAGRIERVLRQRAERRLGL